MNFSFLLNGAGYIKANRSMVQNETNILAGETAVCSNVKAQLRALASAGVGKCNTGLNESGWRPLAEVIGMVSPRSTKLFDNSPENKKLILDNFLRTGNYPSTRKGKNGGSKADYSATAVAEQAEQGVRSQNKDAETYQKGLRLQTKPLSLKEAMELAMASVKGLETQTVPTIKPATSNKSAKG